MHAHTNISSRATEPCEDGASLRIGIPTPSERSNLNLITSPTGGGTKTLRHTAISQHDDVPDHEEHEEIRSVSTLYNANDIKKSHHSGFKHGVTAETIKERKTRPNMAITQEHDEEAEDIDQDVHFKNKNNQKKELYPKPSFRKNEVSVVESNGTGVLDSFANFFKNK